MFNMIDGYILTLIHLFFVNSYRRMNPFTYISNISRNNKSNAERVNNTESFCKSPEIIAIMVFAFIYVLIRLIETYVVPRVPGFLTREVSSLFRWGPILVPIIFGITYFSKKKIKNPITPKDYSDEVLKERIMAWTKK